jgi:hypothetical protein
MSSRAVAAWNREGRTKAGNVAQDEERIKHTEPRLNDASNASIDPSYEMREERSPGETRSTKK